MSLPKHLADDINYLLNHDPVFKTQNISVDDFNWRARDAMFLSLVRTIIGQQLSTKAADSIWRRVQEGVGDISCAGFHKMDDDALRGLGLSRPKIKYLRGLVTAIESGQFNPDNLDKKTDEEIIEDITALNGFGEWSAQMILIFTLHRPDVWPAGDLGIREGVRLYQKKKERPDIDATAKFGKQIFKKYNGRRTAASLLLWRMKDAA